MKYIVESVAGLIVIINIGFYIIKKYILLFGLWLTGVAFGYWWCWNALI